MIKAATGRRSPGRAGLWRGEANPGRRGPLPQRHGTDGRLGSIHSALLGGLRAAIARSSARQGKHHDLRRQRSNCVCSQPFRRLVRHFPSQHLLRPCFPDPTPTCIHPRSAFKTHDVETPNSSLQVAPSKTLRHRNRTFPEPASAGAFSDTALGLPRSWASAISSACASAKWRHYRPAAFSSLQVRQESPT